MSLAYDCNLQRFILFVELSIGTDFESESEEREQHFLGPLHETKNWIASAYQADNIHLYSPVEEPLGNFTTDSVIECRIGCITDLQCGAWFYYR